MAEDELAQDEEAPAELTETMIRYIGTSNVRSLSARDLSNDPEASTAPAMVWEGNGYDLRWADWLELSGSEERAREILAVNALDFKLVGPGSEELAAPDEEEFVVGGPVA